MRGLNTSFIKSGSLFGSEERSRDLEPLGLDLLDEFWNETRGHVPPLHLTTFVQTVLLEDEDILHVTVPGALEVPLALKKMADTNQFDALIALGAVIRGETYHFEVVSNESARALMDLGVNHHLAIGNGILTTENEQQAIVRADPNQADKGGDAARAALALYHLKQRGGAR